MSEQVDGILVETTSINFASVLVYNGAHLRDVVADPSERPPPCTFKFVWTGEFWRGIGRIDDSIRHEAIALLREACRQIAFVNDRTRESEIQAVIARLEDCPGDLNESFDAFQRLWRSRRVRIEPQEFDKARRIVTDAMRRAQTECMRRGSNV